MVFVISVTYSCCLSHFLEQILNVEQILSQAIVFMNCYQQFTPYPILLYDPFSGLMSYVNIVYI